MGEDIVNSVGNKRSNLKSKRMRYDLRALYSSSSWWRRRYVRKSETIHRTLLYCNVQYMYRPSRISRQGHHGQGTTAVHGLAPQPSTTPNNVGVLPLFQVAFACCSAPKQYPSRKPKEGRLVVVLVGKTIPTRSSPAWHPRVGVGNANKDGRASFTYILHVCTHYISCYEVIERVNGNDWVVKKNYVCCYW